MKVTVIFKNKYDITNLIEGHINFKDGIDMIAYDVDFGIRCIDKLIEIGYEMNDPIKIIDNESKDTIFDGILYEYSYDRKYSITAKWQLYEKCKILGDNEDEFLGIEDTTATQRAKEICSKWGIPNNLADTEVKLSAGEPKINSLFAVIQDDLKETVEKGGKMYRAYFPSNKLEFFEIGSNKKIFDITKLGIKESGKRSSADAVTQVKVIAKKNEGDGKGGGNEKPNNELSEYIATYSQGTELLGVRQRVVERSETEDAKSAEELANTKFKGITHETTYEILDIPQLRAGHKVKLYSRYYIISQIQRTVADHGVAKLTLLTEDMIRSEYFANRE